MNNIVCKTSNKSDLTELNFGDRVLTDKNSICNAFNLHFATAGENVRQTIKGNPQQTAESYLKTSVNCLLFSPVSEQYICKIVSSLQSKQSSGHDGSCNAFLKSIINVIKVPICIVFNKSLRNGEFPELMKHAKIVPMFKSGSRASPDNYHPISLLPVISKVLERVVYNFMVAHLMSNKILYPKQFGFRKDHSTSDAVMNLVGDILNSFDKGFMLLSVFIDLKKAFDTVPHSLVLKKLQSIGVQGVELEWFTDYMHSRKQSVSIEQAVSEPKDITIGIQQGSLLGALLFQLLINDLPNCLKFCTSILYADDTTLYVYGKSLRFLRQKMQSDLNSLQGWLCANMLKLNVSKTKVLLFNRENLFPNIALCIDNE